MAEARSASTSAVPASVPLAPLWGLLLWWLPFDDLAANYDHLREVRRHLSARYGLGVEETVLEGDGGGLLFKSLVREEEEERVGAGAYMDVRKQSQ